ncbi:YagK/YfjJ domain-containing protein [Pseudoalteromonas ruthenica]|uniref:YagK/YfjJ domain-containing protein n=1 Tax=Pseudoalteromonas ruthenica TaxID=151081 RepID=UPI0006969066|nr:inovirus-type Gp2 protein [Pseudoalteromonas ruthenica]TMO94593.1 inovirus Gp2 family protein [Pseudoalteromonas ruthenica]TMO97248.1 inovirus Gp2 family protein [Pseudoalteromonas ruthenica]TMP09202.1 inovirus Gp2 family protein [Pseudoalteromonas ruthenica]TMP12216.1 inovirus Gp2 family protein [Pseudoalteromonas ruthenica]
MSFVITTNNSYDFKYKNHSYKVYKPKCGEQNHSALTRVFKEVEQMLSYYSKVVVVRIDFKPNEYSSNNSQMLKFLRRKREELSQRYDCKVSYIVTRERQHSCKQHYHAAFLLSGHKVKHSALVSKDLKSDWEANKLGVASYVKNPFYLLARGDKASIEPAIYRLSYFTKKVTKERDCKAHKFLFGKIGYSDSRFTSHDNDKLLVCPKATYQNHVHGFPFEKQVNNTAGGVMSHTTSDTNKESCYNDHHSYQNPMNRVVITQSQRSHSTEVITHSPNLKMVHDFNSLNLLVSNTVFCEKALADELSSPTKFQKANPMNRNFSPKAITSQGLIYDSI